MAEEPPPAAQGRPAWSRDSAAVRLPGAVSLEDLSPQWAYGGASGEGVRVAIIDSGIDADHPAVGGAVDAGSGGVVWMHDDEPVVVSEPHRDSFGHGTACAGIVHRIAPEAQIVSVKVLGDGSSGNAAAFLCGLAWAIEQGFEVINLSLGTTRRDRALAFHELCDEAYFQGSFLVTAANNIARPSFPSLYSSVASVACNTATDPMRFHYNPDPPTEFLARGIDVEVASIAGTSTQATGNSYAAPHIAAIAALIRSKHPGLRPFQVKTVLLACAANVREVPDGIAGRISRTMRTAPAFGRSAS